MNQPDPQSRVDNPVHIPIPSDPQSRADNPVRATPLRQPAALRYARRLNLWTQYQALPAGLSLRQAAIRLRVPVATLSRVAHAVATRGLDGLKDAHHNSGRRPALQLTQEETHTLSALYLRTNRAKDAGSMRAACKFFALLPETRPELSQAILSQLDLNRLPGFAVQALRPVTATHFQALRSPSRLGPNSFSGRRGSFSNDKLHRRRVVEADDATLNFPAWIPWPHGGDPASDKFGVRLGRWQFLPALEAGWSHAYLGYTLVARPRGAYTADDLRSLIHMVATRHGLPDTFRFERGTWESNAVVNLLESLGVTLDTVWQSNQKPFIEGGFNKLWTYLSLIDGQVGRFRGECEANSRLLQQCRAGRANPKDHFPSLKQTLAAIDGALAMHNSDTIHSASYGSWIPDLRAKQLQEERPWNPLPADLAYLFSPVVREWTVAKGVVGNQLTLADGLRLPFYFHHDDLWRLNGKPVRLHFDPGAPEVAATVTALVDHAGYKPGEVVCVASLFGDIPHHARAALGWADPATPPATPSNRAPLAALRREVRALAPRGQLIASTSEHRDGAGNANKVERTILSASPTPSPRATPRRDGDGDPIQSESVRLNPGRATTIQPHTIERILL